MYKYQHHTMEMNSCRRYVSLAVLLFTAFLPAKAVALRSSVSEYYTIWTEASRRCNLDTPSIRFSKRRNVVNMNGIPELGTWKTAWVGYYMTLNSFEYIGCVDKAELFPNSIPTYLETADDPGQCYSACGYREFFGLLIHECYCLSEDTVAAVKNKRRYCNQCTNNGEGSQGPACGSYRNTSNIALYRANKAVDDKLDIEVHEPPETLNHVCLGYFPGNSSYIWARCTVRMRIMCKHEDGEVRPIEMWAPWIGSMIICYENSSNPVTFADARSVRNYSGDDWVWTGVVRGQVIYSRQANQEYLNNGKISYGYITKSPTDGFTLYFSPDNSVKRKSLCTKDSAWTTVPSMYTVTTLVTTSHVTSQPTMSPVTTQPTMTPVTAQPDLRESAKTENTLPVYVFVVAILILLLVISGLVVGILWMRRSGKNTQIATSNVTKMKPFNNADVTDDIINPTSPDVPLAARTQHYSMDSHYEEPLSITATASFHNYDTPSSNQSVEHYDQPEPSNPVGARYETLGAISVDTYAKVQQ